MLSQNEWTIIFLIYADFRKDERDTNDTDLKKELTRLKNELKKCELDDRMKILIVENIVSPNAKDKRFDKTVVSTVARAASENQNEIKELETIDTPFVAQKKDGLINIFKKIHNNSYSQTSYSQTTRASRYFLITWDHGSAFGIFKRKFIERKPEENETLPNITLKVANNGAIANDFTLARKEKKPVSFLKTKNDTYQKRLRHWEKPVYRYYDKNKVFSDQDQTFLFGLNANEPSEDSLRQKIDNTEITKYLKIDTTRRCSLAFSRENNINAKDLIANDSAEEINKNKDETDLPNTTSKVFDILTNEELQQTIEIGFANEDETTKKIDVLLMMNCYMMNMHTCYALKNNVDYLVAPQGSISAPGYNYGFILKQIFNSLNNVIIESRELAELCVYSAGYEVFPARAKFKKEIDQWVIVATQLNEYKKVGDIVDEISKTAIEILKHFNGDPSFIFSGVRNRCIRFDDLSLRYFMIDITHWLSEIIRDLPQSKIDVSLFRNSYISLLELIEKKICMVRIGPKLYSSEAYQLITRKPYGTTIYFPDKTLEGEDFNFFVDRNSHQQSLLLKEKPNWLKFLKKEFN
jgi:hypothetical protein